MSPQAIAVAALIAAMGVPFYMSVSEVAAPPPVLMEVAR